MHVDPQGCRSQVTDGQVLWRKTHRTDGKVEKVRVEDASVPAAASPPTQLLGEHTAPVCQVLTGTARSGRITLTVVFLAIGSHY